jgi:hypothetical protein
MGVRGGEINRRKRISRAFAQSGSSLRLVPGVTVVECASAHGRKQTRVLKHALTDLARLESGSSLCTPGTSLNEDPDSSANWIPASPALHDRTQRGR